MVEQVPDLAQAPPSPSDTTPLPSLGTPDEFFAQRAQAGALRGMQDSDADPASAARAIELGQATGVPPEIIHPQLDNFEDQHRRQITADIIKNNHYLSDYANSNPMATKVSANDWGNLHTFSESLQRLAKYKAAGQIGSVLGAGAKDFAAGFGDGSWGSTYLDMDKVQRDVQDSFIGTQLTAAGIVAGIPAEALFRTISGGMAGAAGMVGEIAHQMGAPAEIVEQTKADLLRTLSDPGMMATLGPLGEIAGAPFALNAMLKKAVQSTKVIQPFAEHGIVPPKGADPLVDQGYVEDAKLGMKVLDDVMKDGEKTETKKLAPDLAKEFARQHIDAKVEIDAEAIRKLYGAEEGKLLEFSPDDNKLGWVPGIQDQFALAEAHGGGVEVPLADMAARMKREVYDELREGIRVRPGGMTLEETKGPKAEVAEEPKPEAGAEPAPPPTAADTIASAAGLRPKGWDVVEAPEAGPSFLPEDATLGKKIAFDDGTSITAAASFPASSILAKVDPEHLNPLPKEIFNFLKPKLDKLAGDIQVHVISKGDMRKLTDMLGFPKIDAPGLHTRWGEGLHEIFLTDDVASGRMGESYASHIIIHEIAHGATVAAMDANPALADGLRALMKEAFDQFPDADRKTHNYAFFGGAGRVFNPAEFIAEAYSKQSFQEALASTKMSPELAKALGIGKGPKTLWDAFREMVRGVLEKVLGKKLPDSILDGVLQIGKIIEQVEGRGEGRAEIGAQAGPKQPDLPGIIKPEGLFDRPAALGMNKERADRYRELIKKQQAENAEFQKAQVEAEERERQTKEWKENYSSVRQEVSEDLKSRPDIAADRFLRLGELYGEKTKPVKLNSTELTPEQKVGLPRDYLSPEGIHPDDLAGLFGYSSGDGLVAGLKQLEAQREMEGLTPQAHFSRLVDAETDRKMRSTYGDLEKNIIEEAKEHVLSPTQMDILHEEMLALGEKAGGPKGQAISKEDIKAWVKAEFDKQPLSAHSSDKYMAAAGRAGQATEDSHLAGEWMEAYKFKQQQVIAIHLAGLAKKLEKEEASYDKLAKRYSKREVPGVPPEFTNWIHDIFMRTGNAVRRSVHDLQDAIGRETHSTLQEFADSKNADGRIWEDDPNAPSDFQVMPVAPFLFDPAYRKPVEDMTPPEFHAVANSIKTLVKNGQDERKVNRAGEKEDLASTIEKMTTQLATLFAGKEQQYALGHKDAGIRHLNNALWAQLLPIEAILNRFDRGDPKGVFREVISRPIIEGNNEFRAKQAEYSKLYRALKWKDAELKKKVDNPLFGDPLRDGEKSALTRENVLAILQNVGNASNLDKLARGYGIKDPGQIMQWLFANTKKEDWDRAQALGDVFKKAFEESAVMYHGLSGVAPERIDLKPVQTPFGLYEGWYHPIIYDPLRPGASKKLMGSSPLEDGSYYRAATPAGYTKKRTGYAAPIQLNFETVPAKLNAILKDTALRPAVSEVAKVFYNADFKKAVTKYYGKEYSDLFIPYLKDVAGMKENKDAAMSGVSRVVEDIRQNISAVLIGLNPSTVMKHGPTAAMLSMKEVGPKAFLSELSGLLSKNDALGERNWTFAMSSSQELQARHRNWQETLTGAHQDVFGENTLRNTVIKLGATPVAISDLLSAVPTWLAAYKDQIRSGETHGDSVAFADTAVRRAHGSSAVAARPALMRSGVGRWVAPFYTFFNEMLQRQYEMAWRAKDAIGQFSEGEYREGLKEVPNLMKGLWAYVVFPALIEQAVSPLVTGQESTGEKAAIMAARTLSSSIPILRDIIEGWLGNRDPTVGLYSTGAKMLTDAIRDIPKGKVAFDKQHAGNTIKHTITAVGVLSGLTNAQMGRTGEFMYNYSTGKERPKDTGAILRGLWHGTTKEPKR